MTRVLIADDEPLAGAALRLFLGDRGHEVRVARTAEEALALGAQLAPDVLVADYLLGGRLTGLDVARQLRARFPDLLVLVTTGLPRPQVAREAADLPDLHLLGKPFDLDALAARIEACPRAAPAPAALGRATRG